MSSSDRDRDPESGQSRADGRYDRLAWIGSLGLSAVWCARAVRDACYQDVVDLAAIVFAASRLRHGETRLLYDRNEFSFNHISHASEALKDHLGFVHITPFVHPPLIAWVAQPLLALSPDALRVVWNGAMSLCITLVVWASTRAFVGDRERPVATLALLALLFIFAPATTALWLGQTTPLIVLLCVCAHASYARGRDGAAGVLLSLPVFWKIAPALLALPWLLRRRSRAVFALVASVIALGLASIAAVGATAHVEYLRTVRVISGKTVMAYNNHSLPAVLLRHVLHGDPLRWVLVPVPIWVTGVLVIVVGTATWRFTPLVRRRATADLDDAFAFGACALLTLLLPGIAWTHYFLLLIPVACVLLAEALRREGRPRAIVGGVAVSGMLLCTTVVVPDTDRVMREGAGGSEAPTIAAVLYLATLLIAWRPGESVAVHRAQNER